MPKYLICIKKPIDSYLNESPIDTKGSHLIAMDQNGCRWIDIDYDGSCWIAMDKPIYIPL